MYVWHVYTVRRPCGTLPTMKQSSTSLSWQSGFTVLELIVTLFLCSLLIVVSLWIAHPKDVSASRRNAARWTDVSHLMQALRRYAADNNGNLPGGLTSKATQIGDAPNMLDLCKAFVPTYMKDVPLDPDNGGQYAINDCRGTATSPGKYVTGYTIQRSADGTVTIAAPSAENKAHISVSYKL